MLTLLYLLFCIYYSKASATSVCPNGLDGNCECWEADHGFLIDCKNINRNLNDLLIPLQKIRIERLRVIGAYWPYLKRLPRLSVRVVQLINCGIENIEEMAFQPVSEHLEELLITNNSLTSVPNFGILAKLLSLNLRYNKINDISSNMLKNMGQLSQLRLDGNHICSLPKNFLKPIRNTLELLDLSGNCFEKELRLNDNQLYEISQFSLDEVPRIRHLYLQNNYLTEFNTAEIVDELTKLETLDISNNRLSRVPLVKGFPNLFQINLENNRISQTDSFTFSENPRLRYINLQNNQISSMAPRTFSDLHSLTRLLLANNAIRYIDKDLFYNMEDLEQLTLSNNSLNELENYTFVGIPSLKMLDLSYNGLHKIALSTFKPLERLMWVDLSNNVLTSLEKGTFEDPIPNIILYGNPIKCDEKIEWLVQYIILNRVRTHLPFQSEVLCAAPPKYASVRLRDFLNKKANDTFHVVTSAFRFATGGSSDIGGMVPSKLLKFFPALEHNENNPYSDVPVFGAITKALPGLRNIPGLNYIPKTSVDQKKDIHSLNTAIEKFSSPLIRIATGESDSIAEIDEAVKAIPDIAANLPVIKEVDLSKLPPGVLAQVLRGQPIPGMKKEAIDTMVREYTLKMYSAALADKEGHPLIDESHYLPKLEDLPKELIEEMMMRKTLPYLNEEQSSIVNGYYIKKAAAALMAGKKDILPDSVLKPQLITMLKMLPPNYDINKIPAKVLEAVAKGRIPDIDSLPGDLRDHILGASNVKDNLEVSKLKTSTVSRKPDFERYDINKVSVDLVKEEEENARKERLRVVTTLSTFVLLLLFLYMRRRRAMLAEKKLDSIYSGSICDCRQVLRERQGETKLLQHERVACQRSEVTT
uniref:LRRCT domain-containing protein n=1 Tax=Syphacia muris TaxID=451379 RepID=A0A0N5AN75_9BILA